MSSRTYPWGGAVAMAWLTSVGGGGCGTSPGPGLLGETLLADASPRNAVPPLASAGRDQEILRGYPFTLAGGASHRPSGGPFRAYWQQLEGELVFLSNESSLTPSFVAPLTEQVLRFQLTVFDQNGRTSDDVQLRVVRQPQASGPLLLGGPDRLLVPTESIDEIIDRERGDDESLEVSVSFVDEVLDPAEPPGWTKPALIRLEQEAGGLRSAPEYIVVFPAGSLRAGARAPTAAITGPNTANPNELVTLEAGRSTDPNGDPLFFRWEQVTGDLVQPIDGRFTASSFSFAAPERAQTLLFRAYVRDYALESAPAEFTVRVGPGLTLNDEPSTLPPTLSPKTAKPTLDLRAHPGNVVWLDALGGLESDDEVTEFRWTQSAGTPVTLVASGRRFAMFIAPEVWVGAVEVLSFSVQGQRDSVLGEPSVVRVEIVPATVNAPPAIVGCSSERETPVGIVVNLRTYIQDTEWDPIATPSELVEGYTLFDTPPPGTIPPTPCRLDAARIRHPDDLSVELLNAYVVLPLGSTEALTLSACDILGACRTWRVDRVALPR